MKEKPNSKGAEEKALASPYEKFRALAAALVKVPKAEADKMAKKVKTRENKKQKSR